MKAYGGVKVQLHAVLTFALGAGECSVSFPGRFIHGWVGSRADLNKVEKREISVPAGK
jgi:hypothetical protein